MQPELVENQYNIYQFKSVEMSNESQYNWGWDCEFMWMHLVGELTGELFKCLVWNLILEKKKKREKNKASSDIYLQLF